LSATSRPAIVRVAAVAVVVGALLYLELATPHGRGGLVHALYDAGHAILFGVVAIAVLVALPGKPGDPPAMRRRTYGTALAIAVGLGLASEMVQFFGPRDADLVDFLRDVAGAAAFLLFAATFERGAIESSSRPHVPVAALARIAAVFVLMLAFVPLAATAMSYGFRNAAFPHLMDFESYWESRFVATRHADITLAFLPEPWNEDRTRLVGMVTFLPGDYSSLILREPVADWSAYRSLRFDVYSTLDREVDLTVRIDDEFAWGRQTYGERYQGKLAIRPGRNEIAIPLEEVREGPRERSLDLARIQQVVVFDKFEGEPYVLYFDSFRLE
jgi:hypothetical protein